MKKPDWKGGCILLGIFVLFVGYMILFQFLSVRYDINRDFVYLPIFLFIYSFFLKDIIKIKDTKKRTKKLLEYLILPLIILSFFVTFELAKLKVAYPPTIVLILPGLYVFLLTIKYREFDGERRHYSGNEAIVVGFSYLLGFFAVAGLPMILLKYMKLAYSEWYWLISIVVGFSLPRLSYILFFKDKSKSPVVTYTIQYPDFSYEEDSPEISLNEATKLVKNFNWKKLLQKKKQIEYKNKETCYPQIIFNSSSGIFSVICENEGNFRVYVDIKTVTGTSRILSIEEVLTLLKHFFENKLESISLEIRLSST